LKPWDLWFMFPFAICAILYVTAPAYGRFMASLPLPGWLGRYDAEYWTWWERTGSAIGAGLSLFGIPVVGPYLGFAAVVAAFTAVAWRYRERP